MNVLGVHLFLAVSILKRRLNVGKGGIRSLEMNEFLTVIWDFLIAPAPMFMILILFIIIWAAMSSHENDKKYHGRK